MAQSTKTPIQARAQTAEQSIGVRGQVAANPSVRWGMPTAAPDSRTQQLAQALTGIQPGLTKYLVAKQDETNLQDASAGQAARVAVGNIDSPEALAKLDKNQSASFQIGYMHMHAALEASKKGREMEAAYLTQFNPDTDNLDDFLAQQLHPSDYQGMDKSYQDVYLPAVTGVADKIRATYQAQVTDKVLQNRKNMIYEGATALADHHAADMTSPDPKDVQTIYDAGQQMGLSKKIIEEQIFSAFSAASVHGNGNPRLLDYFFKPRADGTPGLANTANFGPHVVEARDQAERHAYSQYMRGLELQKLQQKQTSDQLAKNLDELYYKGQNIRPLVLQYKDYLTADDFKFYNKLSAEGKFEPEDPQEAAQHEYLVSIGAEDMADVKLAYNNNEINRTTMSRLIDKARMVAESGSPVQNSLEAKHARQFIETLASPGGVLATLDDAGKARKANALRDLEVGLAQAQTAQEIDGLTDRIVKAYNFSNPKSAQPNYGRRPVAQAVLPSGNVEDWKRETVRRFKSLGRAASPKDVADFNDEMKFLESIAAPQPQSQ